jgi:hypothetical protein
VDEFDELNNAVTETFGTKQTVTYRPRGRASFGIPHAIFDDNHQLLSFEDGVEVSRTVPALFVKRADLEPIGGRVDDEDRVAIGTEVFRVADEQPDSEGGVVIILQRMRGRP